MNRDTTGQQAQRNAFGFVSQAWRGLTSVQQNAWIAPAGQFTRKDKTGATISLTGAALFASCNILKRRMGLALVNTPPTSTENVAITPPTATLTATTRVLSLTFSADAWNAATGGVLVSCSAVIQPGRNYVGKYTTVGFHVNPATSATSFTIPFTLIAGDTIEIRCAAIAPDGRPSNVCKFRSTSV